MNENSTIVNVKCFAGSKGLSEPVNVSMSDDVNDLFIQEVEPGDQSQIYPSVSQTSSNMGLHKIIIQANEPIENVLTFVSISGLDDNNFVVTKNVKKRFWLIHFVPPGGKNKTDTTTVNVHLGEDEGDPPPGMRFASAAMAGFGVGVAAGAALSGISTALAGAVAVASLGVAGYLWRMSRS